MTLDAKLHWKEHVKIKQAELDIKFVTINCLPCKRSMLSNYNKLLICKQILKPVCRYGIQLWGSSTDLNIDIFQRFRNKVKRIIMKCPWQIRNADFHRDVEIDPVKTVIQNYALTHLERLLNHTNYEVSNILIVPAGLQYISIRIESAFERLSKYNTSRSKSYDFSADLFINTIQMA